MVEGLGVGVALLADAREAGAEAAVKARLWTEEARRQEGRSLHTEAAAVGLGRLPAVHCRSTVAGRLAHPCGARLCHRQKKKVGARQAPPFSLKATDTGPGSRMNGSPSPFSGYSSSSYCFVVFLAPNAPTTRWVRPCSE